MIEQDQSHNDASTLELERAAQALNGIFRRDREHRPYVLLRVGSYYALIQHSVFADLKWFVKYPLGVAHAPPKLRPLKNIHALRRYLAHCIKTESRLQPSQRSKRKGA